jgi:shikimate dehydrogenase
MTLGLVGEKLSHSLSPIIHKMVFDVLKQDGTYDLLPMHKADLKGFYGEMKSGAYSGVNITIPYKAESMQYLDKISDEAKSIGAVNTVIASQGKLLGYNTDYYGFGQMLKHNFIAVKGKRFCILGAGGSAKAVVCYLVDHGAKSVDVYTRDINKADFDIRLDGYNLKSYDDLDLTDSVLINTTPVGMYPNIDASPVTIKSLKKCKCVVDLIYNPTTTMLLSFANELGIQAVNGFYMLISQGIKSQEIWQSRALGENLTRTIYNAIKPSGKGNLILIGMPGCGKSSIGKALAIKLSMNLTDMDDYIEKHYDKIENLFEKGESYFRDIETTVAKAISLKTDTVICTGGGVITRAENIYALAKSGTIVFIDRPLDSILSDIEHNTRPLLDGNAQSVIDLYNRRYDIYNKSCHNKIINDQNVQTCVDKIINIWKGKKL